MSDLVLPKKGESVELSIEQVALLHDIQADEVKRLRAQLADANKEIEGLKKGNDALRALWKKNKNFHTKDGCICRFDEDGETVLEECGIHGSMRKEIERLKAENGTLKNLGITQQEEIEQLEDNIEAIYSDHRWNG